MNVFRRDFPRVRIDEVPVVEDDAITASVHNEGIVATAASERHSSEHVADEDVVIVATDQIVDIAIFPGHQSP